MAAQVGDLAPSLEVGRSAVGLIDLTVLDDRLRLDALRRLNLLDTPPKLSLDRLIRLACDLLDAPIGLLTLVGRDRQFFLAAYGLPEPLASTRQTSLDWPLCRYAVASGRPLIVGDTRDDPVLATHPVVRQLGVLAYAGIPLTDPEGYVFGTFCVIDVVRRDWDDAQLASLARLAHIAVEVCVQQPESTRLAEAGHVVSPTY
jgi:GAF domain-containing protein